jgi:hypothetical protein
VYAVDNEATVAFDLRNDPGERAPLVPDELPRAAPLVVALDAFLREGSATLELRATGFAGSVTLSLLFGETPLEVAARDLEEEDELTVSREQASTLLRLSCPHGDVDGVTFVLPSANTAVKINGMVGSRLLRPGELTLGAGRHPTSLPAHTRVGERALWLPAGQGPDEVSRRAGVHLSTPDTVASAVGSIVLDAELDSQLKALGYID